jgi:hypothetical protein
MGMEVRGQTPPTTDLTAMRWALQFAVAVELCGHVVVEGTEL